MSEQNRALTLRWFDEIWNQRRKATIDELASPRLEAFMEGIDGPMTKDDVKAYYDGLVSAIDHLHVEIEETSLEGPKVVVSWHLTGTHTGPGLGVPPSGRPVSIRGLTWFEWEEGQLVRGWDKWNRGEMIASLMQAQMRELQERHGLTPRESQVALLMAERRRYREIAEALEIMPNTARRHCERVLRKLGVRQREAVAEALGFRTRAALARHGSDMRGERANE